MSEHFHQHFNLGEVSDESNQSEVWISASSYSDKNFFTRVWSKGFNRMIIYIWTIVLVLFNIITGVIYRNTNEVTDEDKKKKNTLKTTLIVVNVLLVCMLLGVFGFFYLRHRNSM